MSNLIIVESPTKARTLSRFLGGEYLIEATMGHIRDLPAKRLGIEIRSKDATPRLRSGQETQSLKVYEFIPDYQVIPGRKKTIIELKKLASSSDKIILATDPDREGEAIAWHVEEILAIRHSERAKRLKKPIGNSDILVGSPASAGSRMRRDLPNAQDDKKGRTIVQRIVFHEITQSAIKEALLHPKSIDTQLVDSQQARRILDRLVGYKLSPLLWNKLGMRWLSAGRVQSVAVRLIVEREREILDFKPVEYWQIDVELTGQTASNPRPVTEYTVNSSGDPVGNKNDNDSLIARLVEIDGKKAEIGNKETADKIVVELKVAAYNVDNVETKENRRYPSAPFTTSSLQQAAVNRFGWSAKRTMRTAQNLYEEGLITYHRTDSTNIASEAITMARTYIDNVYGKDYLPINPKFYKTKSRVAQEAHEAIRPTEVKLIAASDVKNIKEEFRSKNSVKYFPQSQGRDAELLYSLIWKRFTACQMNEAVFDQTRIDIKAVSVKDSSGVTPLSGGSPDGGGSRNNEYFLRTTGQKLKFPGWLILYDRIKNESVENFGNNGDSVNRELPELTVGEVLKFLNIFPQQKFTEAKPRYNEASLIKTLEEKGIGRPSTYAPIISTIQDRKYVEKIEKKFRPTDLGFAVTDFLVKHFPDILDIAFTAHLEEELDEIANGKLILRGVLNDFYGPFQIKLESVFKDADRVKLNLGTTDEKCPKCGSPLAVRLSKYGKFLACSAFPDCKYTKNILEKAGIACPRCGGDIIVKKTRHGKQFYGCSNYPKCTFAAWKKEEIK